MTGMLKGSTRANPAFELSWKGMTVGADVGDKYSSLCFLDELGEVTEESRIRTTEQALHRRFEGMTSCRIVLEAGTHSPWLSRLLAGLGHEVIVANPFKVRLIAESGVKNDRSDAETLARLGRIDPRLLGPIKHREQDAQVDLAAVRSRHALIRTRSLLINHVRGAVKSSGSRLPACDATSFPRKAVPFLPDALRPALEPLLATIADLTCRISELDRRIIELIDERYPEAKFLQQVPGVGPLIALTFVLTIGDPWRFPKSRQVGAYLGLVPRQRTSGESAPQLGISKVGNSYLRQLLVNGANYVLGYRGPDTDLRRWGLKHAATGSSSAKKRAVIAVARKLAVLLHHLWLTGEVYEPIRLEVSAA